MDVPAIDSVLFGSPKDSVIDIIQIAGRALRPHGDVDTATIIVPALLPSGPDDPGAVDDADPQRVQGPGPACLPGPCTMICGGSCCLPGPSPSPAAQAARAARDGLPSAALSVAILAARIPLPRRNDRVGGTFRVPPTPRGARLPGYRGRRNRRSRNAEQTRIPVLYSGSSAGSGRF